MALCQLSAGFLVPRQCENEATGVCVDCGRLICALHSAPSETGVKCTVCATGTGRYYDPETMYGPPADRSLLDEDDDALFRQPPPGEDDDEDVS